MSVSAETIQKMDYLRDDQMRVVSNLIDYFLKTPVEVFDSICEEGLQNPMADEEIDDFVSGVREERHAGTHRN